MSNNWIKADELVLRLREEFGYPPFGANLVAQKLAAAAKPVKDAFLYYWQTGVLDERLEIEGYTIARLVSEHSMKPIAAFLTLDWLAREPEAARASLARGHDRIKIAST